jgi:hypothetical protein
LQLSSETLLDVPEVEINTMIEKVVLSLKTANNFERQ